MWFSPGKYSPSITRVLSYCCMLVEFSLEHPDSALCTRLCINWFTEVLRRKTVFQSLLDEEGQQQFIIFAILVFEQVWLIRNKVRMGSQVPDWTTVSNTLNQLLHQYWLAAKTTNLTRPGQLTPPCWNSPLLGELKFNVDAAFSYFNAVSGIIVKNHYGHIVRVWSHHFPSPNPYCVEMEVVIQAFKLIEKMNLDKTTFESDSLGVVLALHSMPEYANWQARDNIRYDRQFLTNHRLLSCSHVNLGVIKVSIILHSGPKVLIFVAMLILMIFHVIFFVLGKMMMSTILIWMMII